MTKIRKILTMILCVILATAVLLAGCGADKQAAVTDNTPEAAGNDSKPADSNEKVSLNMMYWDQVQKPFIDEMIAGFEKANPNIKINSTIVPWAQYWEKLQTTTVGQNAPDIFWMNVPNFPKYSTSGALLDLQAYINADGVDVGVFPVDLIERYTYNGNVHCIPEQYDTIGLVYNKEIFDNAGEKYPDDTWTWDTLREVAKKLTRADGSQYGFAAVNANQSGYYNFMVMNNGGIISSDRKSSEFDKPGSVEAVQYLLDLMYKDKVSPTGQQMVETTGEDMFCSGKVAMTTIGSWYAPVVFKSLGEKASVAPLPKSPETDERKSIIHGLSWTGYSKTRHPAEVWKVIKHLVSEDSMKLLAETGITVPSYKGMEGAWVNAIPSMNLQVFIDAAAYSHPYPVSQKTAEWMEVESKELTDAWLGKQSAEEAMKKIANQMNEILKSEK